ncbi:MFS transporter [Levilactobacillus acidifarinae]|uniref:MFS family major facilitator transporter n=1 Tax=Levilactobacillus acidifarinae DSM 19394 = JCM 15949 TaxID=1423715 RepID=A0A0R1LFH0_9LACO|nr:MFS transporter [Levilactobacillus acidifarinae]KRK94429.1 MFS family major facilitator transporter [Levilactobacillus acidifarinae DSM 19394]GEO68171.1 MFS transporter [Levilactobacillus acidifarinae]
MFKNAKTTLILLTAMNLRLAVTAITPLFGTIQRALHVTSATTALLVTIPLLCFAGGALLTPRLHQRFGAQPLLLTSTGLLVIANLLRPTNTFCLLIGTLLIGLAIAALNVLVPIMIAQTSSSHATTTRLTSYYAVTMNVVAAVGTALAIPLAQLWGWATVLRSFALPAAVTLGVTLWVKLPRSPRQTQSTTADHANLLSLLVHDRTARLLTLFMGLQSLVFYSLIAWLPDIFHALGATTTQAGNLLAVFQLVGIPAALVLNWVTNPRHLLWGLGAGYLVGLLSLAWTGAGWWVAASVLGFTAALIFSLALNLIATSSAVVTTVAHRSALAQSVGYLLAATGPVLLGQLHDVTHTWFPVLGLFLLLMGLTIGLGFRLAHRLANHH